MERNCECPAEKFYEEHKTQIKKLVIERIIQARNSRRSPAYQEESASDIYSGIGCRDQLDSALPTAEDSNIQDRHSRDNSFHPTDISIEQRIDNTSLSFVDSSQKTTASSLPTDNISVKSKQSKATRRSQTSVISRFSEKLRKKEAPTESYTSKGLDKKGVYAALSHPDKVKRKQVVSIKTPRSITFPQNFTNITGRTPSSAQYSSASQYLPPDSIDLSQVSNQDRYSQELHAYERMLAEKMQYLFDQKYGDEASSEEGCSYMNLKRERSAAVDWLFFKRRIGQASDSQVGEESDFEPERAAQFGKPTSTWIPGSKQQAQNYLQDHKIYEFFHYLSSHLVATSPENPIEYLITLLDDCVQYREGRREPPLLFEPKHVESLFNSMDPMGTGYIDLNQYHTGMFTLGIAEYNNFPILLNDNQIEKKVFIDEAVNRAKQLLSDMIRITEVPLSSNKSMTRTSLSELMTLCTALPRGGSCPGASPQISSLTETVSTCTCKT